MTIKDLHFGKDELDFMSETSFYRTKKTVSEKIIRLLNKTVVEIDDFLEQKPKLSKIAQWQQLKISKGENYKGLPYFVLDHPKHFNKKDIFSFRTLFIWGRDFLNVLHVHGTFLKLLPNFSELRSKCSDSAEIGMYVDGDPWNYDPGDHLREIRNQIHEQDYQRQINQRKFLKLARTLDLKQWGQLPEFSRESIELFFNCLNIIK